MLRATLTRSPTNPNVLASLAHVLADQGKTDEARGLFERFAVKNFENIPHTQVRVNALFTHGLVCARLGDERRAALLLDLLQPYGGRCAVIGMGAGSNGAIDRVLGMLAALLRRWDRSATHFELALATNERLGARPWLAHTFVQYATMLLTRAALGDLDEAAEMATQGAALAEQLGINGLLPQARDLQQRIEHARQIAVTLRGARAAEPAPDGLTVREVEVLSLLAGGHTNKEIAEHLVLSPLTVARHITKIYGKIGARGRADATAYAVTHGLSDRAR
jgi:DNA-binding CsgD family transcriptional regulator